VGHVHVDATIRGRRPASVRFVVDTGATYSLISADLAKRVGIEAGPVRDRVRLASGRTVRLPTALGGIRIEGREAATIFWIGPATSLCSGSKHSKLLACRSTPRGRGSGRPDRTRRASAALGAA